MIRGPAAAGEPGAEQHDCGSGPLKRVDHLGADGDETRRRMARRLLDALTEDLARASDPDTEDAVWVEGSTWNPVWRTAPVDVGPMLQEQLWARTPAVLTSATVPMNLAGRLGLPDDGHDSLDVGSPFDYRSLGLLYCAKRLPGPKDPGWAQAVQQEIARMAVAAGGRTLALFTSYGAMSGAAEAVRATTGVASRVGVVGTSRCLSLTVDRCDQPRHSRRHQRGRRRNRSAHRPARLRARSPPGSIASTAGRQGRLRGREEPHPAASAQDEDRVRARRRSSVRRNTSSRPGNSLRAVRKTGGGVGMSPRGMLTSGRFSCGLLHRPDAAARRASPGLWGFMQVLEPGWRSGSGSRRCHRRRPSQRCRRRWAVG